MKKMLSRRARKLGTYLRYVKMNSIKPFSEKPSLERFHKKAFGDNDLGASDLFSLFTADIIKEKTTFTR